MKEPMTSGDFKEWRRALRITQAEVAALMDISKRQITAYELGEFPIPRLVVYACRWLAEHPPKPVRKGPRTGPRMPRCLPLYHVEADSRTGLWHGEPAATGETVEAAKWRRDPDSYTWTTENETRAVRISWLP